jgi:propanol-preferring alcohol dehydrogenase
LRRPDRLGLYGFGASAHIVAQVAKWQGRSVFAFTRPGDVATQAFARSLGATRAAGSDEMPPDPLDAAIIFATVGDLVPQALKAVRKGGRVVCAGIHMSNIPSFPYPTERPTDPYYLRRSLVIEIAAGDISIGKWRAEAGW